MPDIMPVSMQDILYCRKPDLREQKISRRLRQVTITQKQKNNGGRQRLIKPLPYACFQSGIADARDIGPPERRRTVGCFLCRVCLRKMKERYFCDTSVSE